MVLKGKPMNSSIIETPATLGSILSYLIEKAGIYEAELSRAINLPRATIHRIRTGKISHPKSSTLLLIANYFQISVDQLLGSTPLNTEAINTPIISNVTLIDWNELNTLNPGLNNLSDYQTFTSYENSENLNAKSLVAVNVKNSEAMWPVFDDQSTIIINTEDTPTNRKFVLAKLYKTEQIIIRRLLIDGDHRILQPINNSFPLITLDKEDTIIGVVIHVKKNL